MRSTKGKTKMKLITKDEIETNCKKIYLRKYEEDFKTQEFKVWVQKCVNFARNNNNLIE